MYVHRTILSEAQSVARYNPPMVKQTRTAANARRAITALAARLMAEDGMVDFGTAKRKAARQLGFRQQDGLPDNGEIEQALRAYQALFQNEEQRERLAHLRRSAVKVMRDLTPYRPYLGGALWNGTATRGAGIEIDLFTDETKALEMFLLNRGITWTTSQARHFNNSLDLRVPIIKFEADGLAITLGVYAWTDERSALKRDSAGNADRGNIEQVLALISTADNAARTEQFLAAIR